jgi:hypothetical protein
MQACYLQSDGRYISAQTSQGWDGPGAGPVSLTWSVDPSAAHKRELFREALNAWARCIHATLVEVPTGGQIRLQWGHDAACRYTLDAEHLAHAYLPPDLGFDRAGQVHLSTTAAWGVQYDPYSVILHELGHVFGLDHCEDPNALMFPFYKGHTRLTMADQRAVAALYRVNFRPSASIGLNR